jgi:serine/threonine-protein kinase
LKNEAKLFSIIAEHRYFPRFYELGEIDDEVFLVLEFINGISLDPLVKGASKGPSPLPISFVCAIVLQIALGLEYLHSLELEPGRPCVHADLRPSNVMVSTQGEVKLIDLGLKGGTFIYMPLRRLHTRTIDYYTDLFALGHIFYELLHRQPLYTGERRFDVYVEMRETKINPETFDPRIPMPLREILTRLLNQEGENYYRSTSELVKDLNRVIKTLGLDLKPSALGEWIQKFSQ